MNLNALLHMDAAALWEDLEVLFAARTGEQLLSPHRDLDKNGRIFIVT